MNTALTSTKTNNIVSFENISHEPVGGKAKGLKRLIDAGVLVPRGFAVYNTHTFDDYQSMDPFLESLGAGSVAVRSSALNEDGEQSSFAGQYETFLNIEGREAVYEAVKKCIDSAGSDRVRTYTNEMHNGADSEIAVVVQRMVNARFAGVCFTADPVTNRRDRIVLNAVAGVGEDLVSGHSQGDSYVFSRSGRVIESRFENNSPLLDDDLLQRIYRESIQIEKNLSMPVDLEWAVDQNGTLYWLQARPITTLTRVHLNELDSPLDNPQHVLTRCNIGEMMPGPVTPLTRSVFGRGIDVGLQDYMCRVGVQKSIVPEDRFILMFYNHLFISMTTLYEVAQYVLLTKKENVDISLCGYVLDNEGNPGKKNVFSRLINLIRYIIYLLGAEKNLSELRELAANYFINTNQDSGDLYRDIDRARDQLFEAWSHHYATSSKSGALNTTALEILGKNKNLTTSDHQRHLAALLIQIEGIDGAQAVLALEEIIDLLNKDAVARDSFIARDENENLEWLFSNESGTAGEKFRDFIRDHGHRCVREAELREKNWASEPGKIISVIRSNLVLQKQSPSDKGREKIAQFDKEKALKDIENNYGKSTARIIGKMLAAMRKSVASRENSKSLCIKMQSIIKDAYLALAEKLIAQGLLADPDQVFFLTHEEIGSCVNHGSRQWQVIAEERRALFPRFIEMSFQDVYYGVPEPVEAHNEVPAGEHELTGVPVSVGTVTGKARVVNSLEEAGNLEKGEIMVAAFTDVGWTPYFSIISALVTEIGSTLSHGAVVAREYGIPAVVGVKGARRRIKTGDTIVVDGEKGTVDILD